MSLEYDFLFLFTDNDIVFLQVRFDIEVLSNHKQWYFLQMVMSEP